MDIPDAPWIREAEATGHYRYGWFNTGPGDDYDNEGGEDYDEEDED